MDIRLYQYIIFPLVGIITLIIGYGYLKDYRDIVDIILGMGVISCAITILIACIWSVITDLKDKFKKPKIR